MSATSATAKPTLHLIQNSLSVSEFKHQISRTANHRDGLVFIGDSVFDLALLFHSISQLENLAFYVIDSDIDARSLHNTLIKKINIIDFEQFVSLTVDADKVITW